MTPTLEDALNAIAPKLGGEGVENLRRLTGGASQETWAFTLRGASEKAKKCILRRTPGGAEPALSKTAIGLENEAKVIAAANRSGVKVPDVLYVCKREDAIGKGFVMNHVEGETLARKILRDTEYDEARGVLAQNCGAALAGIHATDFAELVEDLPTSTGLDQVS